MKKPCMDRGRQELICEIMALGYFINIYTSFCVFVDYSGHVDSLRVDITSSKEDYHDYILRSQIITKWEKKYSREPYGDLKAKRDILREILSEQEIPFWAERMERITECHSNYIF